jgi:hypothetical protein
MRFDAISRNFSLVMPGQKAPGAVFKHQEGGIDRSSREIDRRIKSGDDTPKDDRAAAAGLTARQRCEAFCIDPEHLHQFKTTARIAPPR